jgi:Na+-translocating ferredoxin:NAD+ oxidoreductase RnfG subunit
MSFFGSELGVAIAWICGIAGFIYSLIQKQANNQLKIQLNNSLSQIQSLQNSLNTVQTDSSKNEVNQNGNKNVYTKQNSGGMNIKM